MQFLADVHLFVNHAVVRDLKKKCWKSITGKKNIYDLLELSVDEALAFFEDKKDIIKKIKPLQDVRVGIY
jgi:excinuclease ABC subunit A